MRQKKLKRYTAFDIAVAVIVIVITVLIAYPLYFCVIASFSEPEQVALGKTLLWIKGFTLNAYKMILEEELLWTGYRNTIIYTVLGTLYNLILTILAAYVLSKKYLPYHNIISWYFFITMYFSGGLIPSYILIRNLGLLDNPLVLVIGAGVSCYNMIIARQYFSTSIQPELYEASYIDGAGELKVFTSIAVPLAKPIIAVLALYYGVGNWNSWYGALIYVYKEKYYPLQLVLRNILISGQMAMSGLDEMSTPEELEYAIYRMRMAQSMKYSIVIAASLPLIIVYPFLQKYFAKGVMIGSVKG